MDERRALELYREWLPFNFSGGGEVTGPAVRVGHGMRESDFQALEPIQDAWRVGPGGRNGMWLATGLHAGSTDLGQRPVSDLGGRSRALTTPRRRFASGRWVESLVAPNPGPLTLDGTRSYILGPAPCAIVDPGPDRASHLDAIEVALGASEAAAVCVTHHHPDHAGGAAELALRLGAPLATTLETARLAGLETPAIPLSPGSTLAFGGGELEVVPAPGHCPDHVCFYWRETGAVFVGDVMLGEGTSMIAPPEGDMAAYLSTLERLRGLQPAVIYPGHGPEIHEAAERLEEYLEHRRGREAQVVAALAGGAADPAEIRALVYPDLDPRLQPAAEGSVRAHLAKLVAEGRVAVDGETYVLTPGG